MISFVKMHGAGNDFVLLTEQSLSDSGVDPSRFATQICNRKSGVGADGVLLLASGQNSPPKMLMYNPDGSIGAMCGNGLRCFIRFVESLGLLPTGNIVETSERTHAFTLQDDGSVEVEMGTPELMPRLIGMPGVEDVPFVRQKMSDHKGFIAKLLKTDLDDLAGQQFLLTAVGMGNPHLVLFTRSVDSVPLRRWGPALEHHPLFSDRCNVHFVEILNPGNVRVRTWERGAGETLACGSGACAVTVAGVLCGFTGRDVRVGMPGGDIDIYYREDQKVLMTGPAEFVFTGSIPKNLVS